MDIYDVAIIGTGPAGLSAAINLKLHNKSFIWLGAKNLSTKVEKSEKIANYPGMGYISGKDLAIMPMGDMFMLSAGSDVYQARTILLATGAAAAKGFEGEEEMLGRGVSYCATCDGFLYKGKTIAVFCGDERFEHEVDYLAELADKVYVASGYAGGKYGRNGSGAEGDNAGKIEMLPKPVKKIKGGLKADGVVLTDDTEVAVDGIFCLRNSIAPTTLLKDLELDGAHIIVDRAMNTNIKGVFAAGDCTGRPYQIAKSVGEGNIAAHTIVEYLAEK